MSEEQAGTSPAAPTIAPQPGLFGTKIPSSVALGIGVLLFFMPFVDIKCNGMVLQNVSGVQLATGFEIKEPDAGNSFFGGLEKKGTTEGDLKSKTENGDPNPFAMAALLSGVIAFSLALLNGKNTVTGSVIAALLGVAALIATMIDIKRKIKLDLPDKTGASMKLDKFGDGMYISVDFTPWFYIALIAFAAGAWFCYRRMQGK